MAAWAMIAASAVSAGLSSLLSGDTSSASYTPNAAWSSMQESVANAIKAGLENGGYTWDAATNDLLKTMAKQSVASSYSGGAQKITSSLAPYGNVGAYGRGLSDFYSSKASSESSAANNIDIQQQLEKLKSYSNLISQGSGMQDPNLSQVQMGLFNAKQPTSTSNLGDALSTGIGTAMNMYKYTTGQKNATDFWNNYFGSGSSSTPYTSMLGSYGMLSGGMQSGGN